MYVLLCYWEFYGDDQLKCGVLVPLILCVESLPHYPVDESYWPSYWHVYVHNFNIKSESSILFLYIKFCKTKWIGELREVNLCFQFTHIYKMFCSFCVIVAYKPACLIDLYPFRRPVWFVLFNICSEQRFFLIHFVLAYVENHAISFRLLWISVCSFFFGGIWMYFYDFVVFHKFLHAGIYHIRPATSSEGWFPPWSTYQHILQDTLQNGRELCWQEASPGSWEEAHHHVWYISQYHIQSSSITWASDIHFSKCMRPDDWGTTHKNSPHFCR